VSNADDRIRYPVLLDVRGRPCLVVGGGAVATRKVGGLLEAGANVFVVAPDLDRALTLRLDVLPLTRLTWAPRPYEAEDLDGSTPWAVVIAATGDAELNRSIAATAAGHGIPANDVTDPTGGPASIPAVHRAGAMTVAVGTGGIHPGASQWIRDSIAHGLGPQVEIVLRVLDEVQASRPETGRPDWRCVVESGMLDAACEGREAEAKERLLGCLSSSSV
jgi:siroheme synthase-like protein